MKKSHTDIAPNYINYLTQYSVDKLYPQYLFPDLTASRFQFVFKFQQKNIMSGYHGSAWRGLLGHSLVATECPFSTPKCNQCNIQKSCAYYCLYERNSTEKGFSNLPRPYIIFPSRKNGSLIYINMTLTGDAVKFLPNIITAWIKAGEIGFGYKKNNFQLYEISHILPDDTIKPLRQNLDIINTLHYLKEYLEDPEKNNDTEPLWKIHLLSPLRLRNKGQVLREPDWFTAFKSLAVRMSALSRYYCDTPRIDNSIWDMLISFFYDSCKTYNHISWQELKRYSSRQKKYVPLSGITGECIIEPMKNKDLWWHWWKIATLFHLGKGTTMGLGKINLKL